MEPTCDDLKAMLADAQKAQHQLLTGKSARVLVDQNGERIEYTAANAQRLAAYIAGLQSQIDRCCGAGSGTSGRGGPMRVWF